jgi:hypothetical protein
MIAAVVLIALNLFTFQAGPGKDVRTKLFKQVQGKVSLAMPDTYLVGARAGQVMTIQLTAPNKSIRLMVMTSRTTEMLADNARSWTGTLPETGDYHIVVDGDERGSTYSMTISIN